MSKSNACHLSPQAVNLLFSSLAEQTDCVLWICTLDYSQQLYLSPSFANIWQMSPELIYQHQSLLQTTVEQEDLSSAFTQIASQQHAIKNNSHAVPELTLLYRIHRPDGEKRFIKDRNFVVANAKGQPAALAGVSYDISLDEWEHCQRTQRDLGENQLQLETDFVHIIEQACIPQLKLSAPTITVGKSIELTVDERNYVVSAREMQCLILMLHGATAKQTAKKLALSPRTVETYIEQLKLKFGSQSKLGLIAKLGNHPLILTLANQWTE